MQDSNNLDELVKQANQEINNPTLNPNEVKTVQTDVGARDGQNKCPKCGSSEIELNIKTGLLRCSFCRHEFEALKVAGLETNIRELQGQVIGSGASDIIADTNEVLTFKCSSCAAEVVIDTSEVTQARCHWCRNTLSVNQQIPNGAVPDVVLPFGVTKDDAKVVIEKFVGKRKFFAHPKFKEEFTTNNVMGVYFPYMVVDINAHALLSGQGEKLIRKYTRGTGKNQETYYDADLYNVEREFDIAVHGLTIESSADKLNKESSNKTNNVINAIMPFDIENCAKWDANYLSGYTSEKRDVNIDQLRELVDTQAKDVTRYKANETLKEYDRGVAWSKEDLAIKGQQWKAAYLPVWLYSYQQVSGNNKVLHYVAVNARTKEVMGSVPIHMPKLLGVSAIIEVIGLFFWWVIFIDWDFGWLFILSGFVYFFIIYSKYRNKDARHKHEAETTSEMSNVRMVDNFVQKRTRLRNAKITGANNMRVGSQNGGKKLIESFIDSNEIASFIKNKTGDDK